MKKRSTEKENLKWDNKETLSIANIIKKQSGKRKLKKTLKIDSINFDNYLAIYI
ncbi:MAG: hypothetical protein NTU73_12245 [Ignavibacteriae bacterium]|nr:hypothetical protein [Ignavibacteriota bacterium]